VAAHDWATWHLKNQPQIARCQFLNGPRHLPCTTILPCHPAVCLPRHPATVLAQLAADVILCHVSPLQWLHMSPIDWSSCLPIHHISLPCVVFRNYHVSSPGVATSSVRTVRTVQSSPFFACLGFRTERDIFCIQILFDEVNIWPESGRRDGRNGVGFVRFRALSFLSIFKPCQASGSNSGSYLPTKRPFGPQKVTD
jgi:hypothetical protein